MSTTGGLVRGAAALLERLEPGGYGEAMCGDLLEELAVSRDRERFWREVTCAVGRSLWRRSGRWGGPILFSIGWTACYPAWRVWGQAWWGAVLPQQAEALSWPMSSVVHLAGVGLPLLTFVWSGLLVYVLRRVAGGARLSWFRLVWSLSISLSVLLVAKIVWLGVTGEPAGEQPLVAAAASAETALPISASVPLLLSVLAAVVGAMPRAGDVPGEHPRVPARRFR